MNYRSVSQSAMFLVLFAVAGVAVVAFTYHSTAERIAHNEKAALLRSINDVVPAERYDNDIFNDVIAVTNEEMLGSPDPVPIYRARKNAAPVAAVFAAVAPDGYNGNIKLLVGVNADGTLSGVRVVTHHETPGLGDAIEIERSNWVHEFDGRSLADPDEKHWKVKRDGGVFDQFTGATITPRAVVKAVHNVLLYFQLHSDTLFKQAPETTP